MRKEELLTAASAKVAEAVLLLSKAGEVRLAAEAQELAEWVAIRSANAMTKPATSLDAVPSTR